jgi:hypothetical protein
VLVIDIMARNTVDMGRFQSMAGGWHGIQRMLGDKTFDWTDVQVEDPEDEEMLV